MEKESFLDRWIGPLIGIGLVIGVIVVSFIWAMMTDDGKEVRGRQAAANNARAAAFTKTFSELLAAVSSYSPPGAFPKDINSGDELSADALSSLYDACNLLKKETSSLRDGVTGKTGIAIDKGLETCADLGTLSKRRTLLVSDILRASSSFKQHVDDALSENARQATDVAATQVRSMASWSK